MKQNLLTLSLLIISLLIAGCSESPLSANGSKDPDVQFWGKDSSWCSTAINTVPAGVVIQKILFREIPRYHVVYDSINHLEWSQKLFKTDTIGLDTADVITGFKSFMVDTITRFDLTPEALKSIRFIPVEYKTVIFSHDMYHDSSYVYKVKFRPVRYL